MSMKWETLLCSKRLNDENYEAQNGRSIFSQDYDRIVFSAPFRRLANKTQVQPLYEHDHVHHRLIHSIEVSTVGRSLAMKVGNWLEGEEYIKPGDANNIANIVQAACVAHDIGNPPFGHSGEEAMGDWFSEIFFSKRAIFADINEDIQSEFIKFEGNAQGFRIISRLEMYRNAGGMRLSKAVLGAFTKYPVTSSVQQRIIKDNNNPYIGQKKFGIFSSDYDSFNDAANSLGLLPQETLCGKNLWQRHPLVFLVEAADNICYNIIDLEDAFVTGELPFHVVNELLHEAAEKPSRNTSDLNKAETIALLRALSIGNAIESCFNAFKKNYSQIMDGSFSQELTDAASISPIFKKIKEYSQDYVFTGRRKTELEVSGRHTIRNIMSGILPIFEDLYQVKWDKNELNTYSKRLIRAIDLDIRDVSDSKQALHALADFTSGMTDRYAVRIARMLAGA